MGELSGAVPAPSSSLPSVPTVEPANTPSDDADSDSGSEPDLDDSNDPDFSPPASPTPSASSEIDPEPSPDFPPSPSASPLPAVHSGSNSPSPSPEPEHSTSSPVPPSDTRDSRTPPVPGAPYTTRSGQSSRPAGEWWKVPPHPYKHARELRQPGHSGSTPESASEAAVIALEEANSFRTLSDAELIKYAFLTSGAEPRSYKEAMKRDDAGLWEQASKQEYNALLKHGVWELCELLAGWKAVSCHWVYRVKTNTDGSVHKYKARLVAQGFSQKPHLDYTETFAPVAKFASLRAVLALAAAEDMEVHHMDVSSTFLNGDLEEETYMAQLEGFAAPGQEHLVCHLKKSIYGLKQSPRQLYKKLHSTWASLNALLITVSGFGLRMASGSLSPLMWTI